MLNEGEMLMKKSLIALAVAGAMTAPMVAQADATLYGSFRAGLAFQDGEDADLRDEATRIGIKGTVDLGLEDTKGLFHWEASANTTDNGTAGNFGSRLSYLGATGSWGTALVGRQYHPHYDTVVSHTNIFNSADGEFGEAFRLGQNDRRTAAVPASVVDGVLVPAAAATTNGYDHKRNDNTIAYASPIMGGFQVIAGAVIAGTEDSSDKDFDGYNIAAQYTGLEGLRVSASYAGTSDNGAAGVDQELWGLGASYKIADFTVAAKYEDREVKNTAGVVTDERDTWELAGMYQMGATALKARFGQMDISTTTATNGTGEGDQWALEVEHKLGNKGRVWVGYTDIESEIASALGVSEDTLVLGYRVDF
jgi:predicted porin